MFSGREKATGVRRVVIRGMPILGPSGRWAQTQRYNNWFYLLHGMLERQRNCVQGRSTQEKNNVKRR